MSDAMMTDFSRMADALTYEEVIAVISLLLERLKKPFTQETQRQSSFLEDMFAVADKEPELHKSEGKWTRDELHRY